MWVACVQYCGFHYDCLYCAVTDAPLQIHERLQRNICSCIEEYDGFVPSHVFLPSITCLEDGGGTCSKGRSTQSPTYVVHDHAINKDKADKGHHGHDDQQPAQVDALVATVWDLAVVKGQQTVDLWRRTTGWSNKSRVNGPTRL